MRLILVEETDLAEAVSLLKSMTSAARRLLAECVEHQELSRKKASAAALALEDAGFIRIRGGGLFDEAIQLLPSLAGEEALEELDNQLQARTTMSVE